MKPWSAEYRQRKLDRVMGKPVAGMSFWEWWIDVWLPAALPIWIHYCGAPWNIVCKVADGAFGDNDKNRGLHITVWKWHWTIYFWEEGHFHIPNIYRDKTKRRRPIPRYRNRDLHDK